ncbi:MAG: metal ABC transporter permease, partial [Hyphomicrobiales bacterium]
LWADALIIAIGGAAVLALVLLLRRPMSLVAFDPEYAASTGMNVSRMDLSMMGLVMAVTVVGLKVVGLILIVALLIIPPVTARFWSNRTDHVVLLAGALGGFSGYAGAAISASAPALPTGPIIVLVSFCLFLVSLFVAPNRGVLAAVLRHLRFQREVHLRQGLLALAQGQPIYEKLTIRLLKRAGLARADGVATENGRARAAKALLDEKRWEIVRSDPLQEAAAAQYDGLTDISLVLTQDQIKDVDARLIQPRMVPS